MLTPVKTSVSLNNPLRRSRKFEFKISNLFNNLAKKVCYPLDDPFPKKLFGTIGFQLGDGIRCLESEAQNTELSLEVAKIQFSLSVL